MKKIIEKMYQIFLFKPGSLLRNNYYKHLRKKLKISASPSIIASDCLGGFISHNLGLQFCSPTVNLYFTKEDFIVFLENLQEFLSAELCEITDSTVSFPVGLLQWGGECVKIYFMHYSSFSEAKQKWDERKKRVDYANLVILWLIPSNLTNEDVIRFEHLPYKRKFLITYENPSNSKNIIVNRVFHKKYFPGKILTYPSKFSIKKYMDEIDYVSILNSEP